MVQWRLAGWGVRGWGCHISRLKNGWRSPTLACMFWELFLFSCFLKFSNDEQCALVFQERYWTSKMHTHIHCSTEALMILQDSGQGKRFTCRHDTVTQPLNYHILKLLTSYCSSIIQAWISKLCVYIFKSTRQKKRKKEKKVHHKSTSCSKSIRS